MFGFTGINELLILMVVIGVLSMTGLWPRIMQGLRELRGEAREIFEVGFRGEQEAVEPCPRHETARPLGAVFELAAGEFRDRRASSRHSERRTCSLLPGAARSRLR